MALKIIKDNLTRLKGFLFRKPSDVQLVLLFLVLITIIFLLQPDVWELPKDQKWSKLFLLDITKYIFNWLTPIAPFLVALLALKNIALTKQSVYVSENTLKQIRFVDQKNTSPMLKFELSIVEGGTASNVFEIERPREVALWEDTVAADSSEKTAPHFLNLKLNNTQAHPQGTAVDINILLKLTFPKSKSSEHITEIVSLPTITFMDPKEEFSIKIMKVSGLPSLKVEVEDISYKNIFGIPSVIGYGMGYFRMEADYKKGKASFKCLTGKSPNDPQG